MRSVLGLRRSLFVGSCVLFLTAWSGGCKTAITIPAATHFSVTAPATATAGTAISFTVTALDSVGAPATSYSGTVHFSSTDVQAVLPANSTLTNGVGTFSATLNTAGSQTITANDTVTGSITGTSGSITVTSLAATHFSVTAPATATAGTAFSFTVTALNSGNQTATSYSGKVHFSTTDVQALLPADSTLTNGVGTFSATLNTVGSQTVTANDTVTPSITGTSGSINVTGNLTPSITTLTPSSAIAGAAAFTLTVNGTNFIPTSVVQWNGTGQPTAFVNGTQVTAQIPAANILNAGTASITVINAASGGGTSNAATFTINPVPSTAGIVQMVSTDNSGNPGTSASFNPAISSDGRYVAFESLATNLAAADTNAATDVFLHDTCRGASAPMTCSISTTRVSLDNSGNQLANGAITGSGRFLSSDGRFVVFQAVIGAVNPIETFVRDTCTGQSSGCMPSTTLVSVNNAGQPADGGGTSDGAISSNGRVVIFFSAATNLVTGGGNGQFGQFYARDTCLGVPSGCTPSTVLVATNNSGVAANSGINTAAINGDGRYIAFETLATNLVANDTNSQDDIFLRDTCIGAPAGCMASTILVSANQTGGVATGQTAFGTHFPSISGNGRFVLFESDATDLVAATIGGHPQIFLRDTCVGASGPCTPGTVPLSATANGAAGNSDGNINGFALLSDTGRYAAFSSLATNLVPGATAGQSYVEDTCFGAPAGCTPKLMIVSLDAQGNQLPASINGIGSDGVPAISGDGHFAVLVKNNLGSQFLQVFLALTDF